MVLHDTRGTVGQRRAFSHLRYKKDRCANPARPSSAGVTAFPRSTASGRGWISSMPIPCFDTIAYSNRARLAPVAAKGVMRTLRLWLPIAVAMTWHIENGERRAPPDSRVELISKSQKPTEYVTDGLLKLRLATSHA